MKNNLMLLEPELSFDSLHQELNNFLRDTFLESSFASPLSQKKASNWRPAIEMLQTEKDYKIKVELPGVRKEDINVELDNDMMKISAEIKEEKIEKGGEGEAKKIHASEFKYGKYVRTICFDSPIKADASTAEYKDGILNIIMPKQKVEKAHTKRLAIK